MTADQLTELVHLLESTTLFPPEGRQLLSIAISDQVLSDQEQAELLHALQEEQDALAAIDISEQVALARLKQEFAAYQS